MKVAEGVEVANQLTLKRGGGVVGYPGFSGRCQSNPRLRKVGERGRRRGLSGVGEKGLACSHWRCDDGGRATAKGRGQLLETGHNEDTAPVLGPLEGAQSCDTETRAC